jgi:hypothetical protein
MLCEGVSVTLENIAEDLMTSCVAFECIVAVINCKKETLAILHANDAIN